MPSRFEGKRYAVVNQDGQHLIGRLYGPSRQEIALPILKIHFAGTVCETLEVRAYNGMTYRFASSLFDAEGAGREVTPIAAAPAEGERT